MLSFGLKSPRRIFYAGEMVRVFLQNDAEFPPGKAFLRTNVGMAAVRRREIINQVENNQRPAGRDWQDLALTQVAPDRFEINLLLTETGIFELKPFFAPAGENAQPACQRRRATHRMRRRALSAAGCAEHRRQRH